MSMIEIIEKAINSKVLIESLILIPKVGATLDEIKEEESLLGKPFSDYHKTLLRKWNGMDLDIIRIYCCGKPSNRIKRIFEEQINQLNSQGFIVFGSDPSGFIYLENDKAEIFSFDTDGGELEFLAKNLDEFFTNLVFGVHSDKFLGEDWKNSLMNADFFKMS
jgi:hypothetical protein